MNKPHSNHPHVEMVAIDYLAVPKRMLRKISERHIERVAASIREFGFIGAILVEADLTVLTGVVRLEAARRLGYLELPVIRVDHLTPAQIRAYRIADNKLAEGVAWDENSLRLEFEEILVLDTTFGLELTGFSTGEIDVVLDVQDGSDPADHSELVPADVAVSRLGDVWQIGPHRLICADAKVASTYATLLGGKAARLVAIDPPYNVGVASIVGRGETKYREFAEASGEMSAQQFEEFLSVCLSAMGAHLVSGGLIYSFMDWKHIETLLAAGRGLDYELLNLAVWNKMKGGMGSFYRSAHELCAVFRKPGASHLNNIELGRHGRNRTNVWDEPGFNSFGRERNKRLADHPTVKPVALIADIIKDASKRGDIVLDGFCGSGTTLLAAEKTGRIAHCVELDPLYVDLALRRFQERFGIEAIHVGTGLGFQEPIPLTGNLIRRNWLGSYITPPHRNEFDLVAQSWDTASNAEEHNDFSVCTTWGVKGERLFLLDLCRKKLEYPELRKEAVRLAQEYKPGIILIERAGTGFALLKDLPQAYRGAFLPKTTPRGDKVSRVAGVSSLIEQGRVVIPEDALWRGEFLKEVLAFPGSRHDDQVDSMEQFLRYIQQWGNRIPRIDANGQRIRERRNVTNRR